MFFIEQKRDISGIQSQINNKETEYFEIDFRKIITSFFSVVMTSQPTNDSELQLYRVLQRANLLNYYDTFISQGKIMLLLVVLVLQNWFKRDTAH